MLSIHLRLGLPSGLFPSGFFTINLYTFLFCPIRATCPAHLIILDFINKISTVEKYYSCEKLFSICIEFFDIGTESNTKHIQHIATSSLS
jgi:hypothetical protein